LLLALYVWSDRPEALVFGVALLLASMGPTKVTLKAPGIAFKIEHGGRWPVARSGRAGPATGDADPPDDG